ncbi:MAG TPA: pyridoxamine 5'-phosphate oxidase family protein [bacterium]|nr:pyridoxamine 5'-phosphate oxidase family protein [bacterium]
MERLADERIQRFLATREVVVLATVQPDGSPLAMPVWFLHRSDDLIMISEADTQKIRNIRRDPRVCVAADGGSLAGIQGVIVQGWAEFLPASAQRLEFVHALLEKYHPELARLWGGNAMPPNRVMFRIVPTRVRSWGLAPT